MIRHIEKISLVNEFKFLGKNLFVLFPNEIKNIETEKNIKGEFYCIRPWHKYLLTQNKQESNVLILDTNLNVIKEISGKSNYALWLLNACDLIPVEDKVFKLNESLELSETKIPVFAKDCTGKFGIRRSKNSVLCDDLEYGRLNWKFELGEDTKVGGDFTILNELVVVTTTNQEIIGIDIKTGKELWRLNGINANSFQKQPGTNYLISFNSNSAGNNWYYVIDPQTGEKIVDKKFANFYFSAGTSTACITATHYYFISNVRGSQTKQEDYRETHLGCINLKTHEIEWIEKVGTTSDGRNQYQKPEVNNGRFYLLDGDQTLHVYEQI